MSCVCQALWINVGVDDWTIQRAIVASNDNYIELLGKCLQKHWKITYLLSGKVNIKTVEK